ncbi:MAG: NupC/NupG family nucleoside CNT transporter [Planctomycetota bacterium]|nr:MAG: NupC/NupG family nucleoside CNT transporter [Planctomycetota bacterium]
MTERLFGLAGVVIFLGACVVLSKDRKSIDRRAVLSGLGLQLLLALFVLRTPFGEGAFKWLGDKVTTLLNYTLEGAGFVFGYQNVGPNSQIGFVFAFEALSTIIFVSSLFTMLYHFGVLQFVVRVLAVFMMKVMRVSGAESLSSAANVFMGQTEAPLIIKPYLAKLTKSELMTLMVSGMATIAGGVLAVYIGMGVDATALITASVMAAPGAMVIAKILQPETEDPLTRGVVRIEVEKTTVNFVDAMARGAGEGMKLAINVAAMLIAFLAMVALVDGMLGFMSEGLTLSSILAKVFAPVAYLIGIPGEHTEAVGSLLGTKLVLNEFVAFANLGTMEELPQRTKVLATFALCGFANLGSIGIQLGGIGALVPERRADLAKLAFRALFGGFLASLLNASIAAVVMA